MYHVYRIVTKSGHTYVGMTDNPARREGGHKWSLRHGRLGECEVPATDTYIFEVLSSHNLRPDALIEESRRITADILDNPLNCNLVVGKVNPYGPSLPEESESARNKRTFLSKYPHLKDQYCD